VEKIVTVERKGKERKVWRGEEHTSATYRAVEKSTPPVHIIMSSTKTQTYISYNPIIQETEEN
jgi:hypothetical protein